MKNPPGRPPLDRTDPSIHVGLTLPSKQYLGLEARANHERVTIQEIIRRDLAEIKSTK